MKDIGIKPNYSELARKYGYDRHTIKKYYENDGVPLRKNVIKTSKWDPYIDEIISLMNKTSITKKGVYMFLLNKYGDDLPGNYNSFKAFTLRKGITLKNEITPHVLYESDPGKQLQVDWKENMKIHLKGGTEITFNVFSATLAYSREHIFIYSTSKTTTDFIRCMIEVFRRIGGTTKEVITDNMAAVVSVRGGSRTVYPKVSQFFKDMNCELKLCKVRTPQTKGKVENSNKFVNWIKPYDYELSNEVELIRTIENVICSQSNQQVNTHTNVPPHALFKKEKEYLRPLPSNLLMESYIEEHVHLKVPSTLLVQYKGNKYSVPSAYIGDYVDLYQCGNELYIYHNAKPITKHNITQNKINYNNDDYSEALRTVIKSNEVNIEAIARANLERLNNLGSKKV